MNTTQELPETTKALAPFRAAVAQGIRDVWLPEADTADLRLWVIDEYGRRLRIVGEEVARGRLRALLHDAKFNDGPSLFQIALTALGCWEEYLTVEHGHATAWLRTRTAAFLPKPPTA